MAVLLLRGLPPEMQLALQHAATLTENTQEQAFLLSRVAASRLA